MFFAASADTPCPKAVRNSRAIAAAAGIVNFFNSINFILQRAFNLSNPFVKMYYIIYIRKGSYIC